MVSINHFEDIEAWKKGREVVKEIYSITKEPRFSRDFALKDQIRRSAISIIANIAEGFERDSNKEFIYFLAIAKGSAGEVRSLLYVAFDEGYIDSITMKKLMATSHASINLIAGFINYLKNANYEGKRKS